MKKWLARPETPEVQDWLRASAVKRCVFHRTAADFDEFDTSLGDLGAHFGPLELVNTLPRYEGSGGEAVPGDRIIPVWLRITNPLRLKDVGSFHADGIALQMARKGLLPLARAREIHSECDANWRARKTHDAQLRELIQRAGFDGVSYLSVFDRAPGECFIAFEAAQVCPALPARVSSSDVEIAVDWPRQR